MKSPTMIYFAGLSSLSLRKMRARRLAIVCLSAMTALLSLGVAKAHDRLPGRSRHGEAFDHGPRQSAYLMGGTGDVHFPVTTKDPLVQKFIDQGVGQLHGFWYVEAERSFRQAAALDPQCAIAYWGMAVATSEMQTTRSQEFAKEAARHKAGLTERERMYIDALTGEEGYKPIIAKYPQDLEAKAFEAWRLWHKYEHFQPPPPEVGEADELAQQVLAAAPMHPMHHAIIHIADHVNRQTDGIDSAAKCGPSAPSIGHMWHMPTHIYFALKEYPRAAWQLEASIRTEHARMIHDRVIPDQVHLYAHNNEWFVRTLLYEGRVQQARRVATNMMDLPRHPLLNVIEPPADADPHEEDELHEHPVETHGTSAYYGRERFLQALRQYEYWDDLIDACRSGLIEPTGLVVEQGKVLLNRGIAEYCRGRSTIGDGDKSLATLRGLSDAQRAAKITVLMEAQSRPLRDQRRAFAAAEKRFNVPIAQLNAQIKELESYQYIAKGFFVSRRMLLVCLAVIVLAEMVAVWFLRRRVVLAVLTVVAGIGVGTWLFQSHLALWDLPYVSTNVDFAYMSRMQLGAGDPDVAEWCARQFATNRPGQVRPQANLVEILYRIGKKDDARAEFEILRELGGRADLDSPPLARLEAVAQEFGYPTDWRLPARIQKALANRRPLESLGPLLWRPWTAPDWKLADAHGKMHSLSEFHGKPVVMLFFLGAKCLHCAKQLETFAKRAEDFSRQGLTVIAISVDEQKGLKESLDRYKPGPFPYLILSDPDVSVFKRYRAYDDFEQIALHGSFVIDKEGLVRWQDVSYEPFQDVDFVLAESKRLLARPAAPVEVGARVIAGTK